MKLVMDVCESYKQNLNSLDKPFQVLRSSQRSTAAANQSYANIQPNRPHTNQLKNAIQSDAFQLAYRLFNNIAPQISQLNSSCSRVTRSNFDHSAFQAVRACLVNILKSRSIVKTTFHHQSLELLSILQMPEIKVDY